MNPEKENAMILGIDVGSASLGWALMKNGQLIETGVRVFDPGMDGDLSKGKESSRNVQRRDARSARRRLFRLKQRLVKLAGILQLAGLLPLGEIKNHNTRHELFEKLDVELIRKNGTPHSLPLFLRKKALTEKLELFELGRILYHICQRRGFLSNRKAPVKDKEEDGKVKAGIKSLKEEIAESGARTLGEYFASLDTDVKRVRTHYTARAMYEDEFNQIWAKQLEYYPDLLTDELNEKIHNAIFYQRPLKIQSHLIGPCQFEKKKHRAPWLFEDSQRFRMYQQLNNTEIFFEDFSKRPLTDDERKKLIDLLENNGDVTFAEARKKNNLNLPKTKFNWETGTEKRFMGNRTAKSLREIFGDRWDSFSEADKEQIVEDIHSIVKDETLYKRGKEKWGLDDEMAEKFIALELEPDYCNLSRKAIGKLLPLLKDGMFYSNAIEQVYGIKEKIEIRENLPPLRSENEYISNPCVIRSLTELRKVVNTIVKTHGKPDRIHIEFARELKQGKKTRVERTKTINDNEKQRTSARNRIIEELKMQYPSRTDELKVLLAEECGWRCPYTGNSFSIGDLFSPTPKLDIEHIIPFSRSLDNSFLNKTLCWAEENRNVKQNRSPWEAYSNTDKYEDIIERVKRFKSNARNRKLELFLMNTEEIKEKYEDFSNRQLNDTSYTARLGRDFVKLLYGDDWRTHLQVSSGGVTSFLRSEWGLNSVLNKDSWDEKTRTDHRHHAIDAIVIALTNHSYIQMLSKASQKKTRDNRTFEKGMVEMPWENFWHDVDNAIKGIVVSHRVEHKASGALHAETFYGEGPDENEDGKPDYYTITRPIDGMKTTEVKQIIDPKIRAMVEEKLGGGDPSKVFQEKTNRPYFVKPDGKVVFINRVKIQVRENPFQLRNGDPTRFVMSDANHHAEVFEYTDKKGNVKWDIAVVPMLEAYRRRSVGEPVIRKDLGEGKKFLFSLAPGDTIEIDVEDGNRKLFVIRTVPQSKQIAFVNLSEARLVKEIKTTGFWFTKMPDTLRQVNCRKVYVDPIGKVRYSNT